MSTVSFKGNIGKVRGLQFSNDGKPRFSFSVAEGHRALDKQTNEWKDTGTTWWNVTVFGRDAETLADAIQEGQKMRVAITGRAQTRDYESNGETRSSLDVIADIVGIVPNGQPQQNTQQAAPAQQGQGWGGQQTAPAADSWSAPSGQQSAWGNGPDSQDPPF